MWHHTSLRLYSVQAGFNFFLKFIYFWLHWVFVAVRGLSLVAASGGTLYCGARASHCGGFSCCGAQAQQLWRRGLVTPRHVGSSWTRAQTHVPCVGRRILNHCTTGKPRTSLLSTFYIILKVMIYGRNPGSFNTTCTQNNYIK